eukprot:scaffold456464_cov14-Prasinocladus_malaysianus.AAC.1
MLQTSVVIHTWATEQISVQQDVIRAGSEVRTDGESNETSGTTRTVALSGIFGSVLPHLRSSQYTHGQRFLPFAAMRYVSYGTKVFDYEYGTISAV